MKLAYNQNAMPLQRQLIQPKDTGQVILKRSKVSPESVGFSLEHPRSNSLNRLRIFRKLRKIFNLCLWRSVSTMKPLKESGLKHKLVSLLTSQ